MLTDIRMPEEIFFEKKNIIINYYTLKSIVNNGDKIK